MTWHSFFQISFILQRIREKKSSFGDHGNFSPEMWSLRLMSDGRQTAVLGRLKQHDYHAGGLVKNEHQRDMVP